MSILVQKFGGTSLMDAERIRGCAARAARARRDGHDVIVVVSAMGHTTDHLIDLANSVSPDAPPHKREMDMLLSTGEQVSIALMTMALHALGIDAVSMTGGQLGIITDTFHTRARIRSIDEQRLRDQLAKGRIIVAAGFQGLTDTGEITTLGRGGSDTTAVALAAALSPPSPHGTPGHRAGGEGASLPSPHGRGAGGEGDCGQKPTALCEIYTDVDGVYTADPRRVRGARLIDRISYEEMLELASLGAGVMHNRAVIFGQRYNVPIRVRHSRTDGQGTLITKETPEMEDVAVIGCALKQDLGRVSLRKVPNEPGVQARIFRHISDAGIMVDDIMQTEFGDLASLSFTVDHTDLADVKVAVGEALDELGTGELAIEIGLAKVSAVGIGMRTQSGVATIMFKALGDAGIPINNITTSEIKISCILPMQHGEKALQIVHDAFGLGE